MLTQSLDKGDLQKMPQMKRNHLHTPLSNKNIERLMGRLEKIVSNQTTAADLTDKRMLDVTGNITRVAFVAEDVAASGESMVIDVLLDGTSVLADPYTYDDAVDAGTVIELELDVPACFIETAGSLLSITREYTAGGGATPLAANTVIVEIV